MIQGFYGRVVEVKPRRHTPSGYVIDTIVIETLPLWKNSKMKPEVAEYQIVGDLTSETHMIQPGAKIAGMVEAKQKDLVSKTGGTFKTTNWSLLGFVCDPRTTIAPTQPQQSFDDFSSGGMTDEDVPF